MVLYHFAKILNHFEWLNQSLPALKISELIGIVGSKLSDKNKRQQITRITDDFFLDRIKDNSVSLYRDLLTDLQKYTEQVL